MRYFIPILCALSMLLTYRASAQADSLKEAYKPYFLIGAAVDPESYAREESESALLIKKHFSAVTPENAMKWDHIHPEPNEYYFTESDRLVAFATKNGIVVNGHTLVWHAQTPSWVFEDGEGKPLTREALLARMRDHIMTVVGRYKGRIKSWDVVNEALNDDGTLRDSPWHKIIGDDYIEKAFEYAHEADPDAELYYNDYLLELPKKCAGAVALVKRLKAVGLRIDGVGIQGHVSLNGFSVKDQEAAIVSIHEAGVTAMITELDMDVLPGTSGWGNAEISRREAADPALDPYIRGLPVEIQGQQAQRYAELFRMYLKHRDKLSRVTFWGLNDLGSWLNGFPVPGRTNHPLLFDRQNKPKPALEAIIGEALRFARVPGSNPVFRDCFTADPAPLVVGDTVYLYVGHDEAKGNEMFKMNEWLCFSSKDMKNWTAHGPIMKVTDFKWATQDAWAAQVVFRNGKYYLFATARHGEPHVGMAIGVAVSDSPTGPFVDARGSALITDDMTPSPYGWDDIDPTVFIDDDGTAWLAWGNPLCHLVKLNPNMTELDGPIQLIALPNYTEGPWLSKHNGAYYLTYPAFAHQGFSERMCYATAPKVTGPWTYRGLLTGQAENSYTIHPGIVDDFNGQSYLIYHNASLTLPDGQSGAVGRRAVCINYLYYNRDGTMQPVWQNGAGVSLPPNPNLYNRKVPVDHGTTDVRLEIHPITSFLPQSWTANPDCSSVSNPFYMTPTPVSFNYNGGVTSIGQTFVPQKDIRMGRISLYAGDGLGTGDGSTLALALYDLGLAGTSGDSESYEAGTNLLGDGNGMSVAYEAQAPGILDIDFAPSVQVNLKAGHRYAIELQGERMSASIFWRLSKSDVYSEGSAYMDRKMAKDREGHGADFSFAIYEAR